jgi:hypothetical protein
MKTYWGSGGIAPLILDLGTRWRSVYKNNRNVKQRRIMLVEVLVELINIRRYHIAKITLLLIYRV